MSTPIPEIQIVETYRDIPIVELSYPETALLTRESHAAQLRAIAAFEAEHVCVIVSYNNVSCSHQYGPDEQAKLYQDPEFQELEDKVLCMLRYHAQSLTALVSAMSAHALIQQGASNFAPDLDSAVRAARRSIEHHTLQQELNEPELA